MSDGDGVLPRSSSYVGTDTWDIDNDGDMTDLVWTATTVVNYLAPEVLLANKQVKGGLDSGFLLSPQFGSSEISDARVEYRLHLNNNAEGDITDFVAIDVLPYVGDHALTAPVGGTLADRGVKLCRVAVDRPRADSDRCCRAASDLAIRYVPGRHLDCDDWPTRTRGDSERRMDAKW